MRKNSGGLSAKNSGGLSGKNSGGLSGENSSGSSEKIPVVCVRKNFSDFSGQKKKSSGLSGTFFYCWRNSPPQAENFRIFKPLSLSEMHFS